MTVPSEPTPFPAGAGEIDPEAFRLIVDRTAHPFVVLGRDGTITYASGSIRGVIGWSAEELVGRNMIEFIAPDQVDRAIAVVTELNESDPYGAGVPMVFEIQGPDGRSTWTEVGALPLPDLPGFEGLVTRHRPYDGQHHFNAFVASLLAGDPLVDVLGHLGRSIAASMMADGVVIHHSFDGTAFAGAAGCGVPDACLSPTDGPWHRVVLSGEPQFVGTGELPDPLIEAARAAGFQTCWAVPVPATEDLAPAALSVWRRSPGSPLIGHRHVLEQSSRYVQLALVRWADHQRLVHLAGHDALTGVANRARFRDRLAEALAIGERDLAVAFCDLDGFKPVNDTHGHRAGDAVLVEVADRLRASLRVGDELARIGGDEFTVLLRNVSDGDAALHVADRLLATVREPFAVDGIEVHLGLSVGIALAEAGATADKLLGLADAALYDVKRGGGGQARVAGMHYSV